MADEIEEVKLGGCLLLAKLIFSEKKNYFCGLCPNKSKDIGNLGAQCVAPKTSVQG